MLHTDALAVSPVAPINALPPGLLELIFDYFSNDQLMCIVSFVCKRWRRTALRCVTHLVLRGGELLNSIAQQTLDQLRSLTSVSVVDSRPTPHGLVFPPSLTGLNVARCSADGLIGFSFPPLKRIELPNATAAHLATLLDRSPALESLLLGSVQIRPDAEVKQQLEDLLLSRTLPSLTSLSLKVVWCYPRLLPFLARHATQLIALELVYFWEHSDDYDHLDELVRLPLTRLQTLTLDEVAPFTDEQLARLIRGAAQLEARDTPTLLQLPLALLSSLVAYSTSDKLDAAQLTTLASLPRLGRLSVSDDDWCCNWRALGGALLSKLDALTVVDACNYPRAVFFDSLSKANNVNRLSLAIYFPLSPLPAESRFPHLRSLDLTVPECKDANFTCVSLAESVSAIVRTAPRLNRLDLNVWPRLPGDVAPLLALVRDLTARGCYVHYEGPALHVRAITQAAGSNPWVRLKLATKAIS